MEMLSKSELRRGLWSELLIGVSFSKEMIKETMLLEEIMRK